MQCAQVAEDNARVTRESQRQTVALEVRRAYLAYQAAREQLTAAQAQQRAGDLAATASQKRYRVGAATFVGLAQTRAGQEQAASALVNARYNLVFQQALMSVVVPNADLFTKSVTVNTAFGRRRSEYDLSLSGDADVAAVKQRLVDVLRGGIEGVSSDPVADVLILKVGGGGVTLRLRWFSSSERGEYLVVQERVLAEVLEALRELDLAPA